MLPLAWSCNFRGGPKMDERVTLRKGDKIPYGTYIAYQGLKYLFPDAQVSVTSQSPSEYTSVIKAYSYNSRSKYQRALYVIIAPEFQPDEREYDALVQFAEAGNHIFISSFKWGAQFADSLKLKIYQPDINPAFFDDSLQLDIKHPVTLDSMWYAYPGKTDETHFIQYDTLYSRVMGHD